MTERCDIIRDLHRREQRALKTVASLEQRLEAVSLDRARDIGSLSTTSPTPFATDKPSNPPESTSEENMVRAHRDFERFTKSHVKAAQVGNMSPSLTWKSIETGFKHPSGTILDLPDIVQLQRETAKFLKAIQDVQILVSQGRIHALTVGHTLKRQYDHFSQRAIEALGNYSTEDRVDHTHHDAVAQVGQVVGHDALDGVGAEALSSIEEALSICEQGGKQRGRRRYRHKNRTNTRSLSRGKTLAGLPGLADLSAVAFAAGKKGPNKMTIVEGRRSRSRRRGRSPLRYISQSRSPSSSCSETRHLDLEPRQLRMEQGSAGLAENVPNRSRGGRSGGRESRFRPRSSRPIWPQYSYYDPQVSIASLYQALS